MKAVVAAFNQEKALVGAFSVIVQIHRLIDLRHYLVVVVAEVLVLEAEHCHHHHQEHHVQQRQEVIAGLVVAARHQPQPLQRYHELSYNTVRVGAVVIER